MRFVDSYKLAVESVSAGDVTPMMLFPIGRFTSAKYPDLPLTRELADEIIANYSAMVLGTDPFVDSSGSHDTSAPAAAWVKRVYVAPTKDGGEAAFADVQWTEVGARKVNDAEYRYNSVELGPVVDNVTGAKTQNVLRSITLTNTPVLRMLPSILEAGDVIAAAEPVEVLCSEIAPATHDHPKSATGLTAGAADLIGGASGHGLSTSEGDPAAAASEDAGKAGVENMKTLALKLNLSEDASEATILAEVVRLQDERNAAVTELAEAKAKAVVDAVLVKLDEKIAGGFIAPAEREALAALAESQPAGAEQAIAVRTFALVKAGEIGEGGASEEKPLAADPTIELAEKAVQIAKERGISEGEAMGVALSEDPALAERYANRTL